MSINVREGRHAKTRVMSRCLSDFESDGELLKTKGVGTDGTEKVGGYEKSCRGRGAS